MVRRRKALAGLGFLFTSILAACFPEKALTREIPTETPIKPSATSTEELLERIFTRTPSPTALKTPTNAPATQEPTATKAPPTPELVFGGDDIHIHGEIAWLDGQSQTSKKFSVTDKSQIPLELADGVPPRDPEFWNTPTGITVQGMPISWGMSAVQLDRTGQYVSSITLPAIFHYLPDVACGVEIPVKGGRFFAFSKLLPDNKEAYWYLYKLPASRCTDLDFSSSSRLIPSEFKSTKYPFNPREQPTLFESIYKTSDLHAFAAAYDNSPMLVHLNSDPLSNNALLSLVQGESINTVESSFRDYFKISVIPDIK